MAAAYRRLIFYILKILKQAKYRMIFCLFSIILIQFLTLSLGAN